MVVFSGDLAAAACAFAELAAAGATPSAVHAADCTADDVALAVMLASLAAQRPQVDWQLEECSLALAATQRSATQALRSERCELSYSELSVHRLHPAHPSQANV